MPVFRVFRGRAAAGADFELLGRIVYRVDPGDDELLPVAEVSDIEVRIYQRDQRDAIYERTAVTVADFLSDTETFNDPGWTRPGGRNFRYPVLVSDLATDGVELKATVVYTFEFRFIRRTAGASPVVYAFEVLMATSKV
jgi:hypothetical protein